MSNRIDDILTDKPFWLAARMLLPVVFTLSGTAKLADFGGGVTKMSRAGQVPAWLFNIAVALILLA